MPMYGASPWSFMVSVATTLCGTQLIQILQFKILRLFYMAPQQIDDMTRILALIFANQV